MVTIGDEVHRVVVRPGATRGRYTLWLDGYRFEVEALDERTRAIRELAGIAGRTERTGAAPRADARADRPRQRAGRRRGAGGAGLVVMEAMKMENELRAQARRDGEGGATRSLAPPSRRARC